MQLTPDQKFDALKLRYEKDVSLLQFMSTLDFQIVGGFITLQLILGSWLSEHAPTQFGAKLGVVAIDLALAGVALALLHRDYKRRCEVVATINNVASALCFDRPGEYIAEGPLAVPTEFRPWMMLYWIAITVTVIGVVLTAFCGNAAVPGIK